MNIFNYIFQSWTPHGHCYNWTPDVLWTNVTGDFGTFIAYILIPIALMRIFSKHVRDALKPFGLILILFSAFIFACGVSHLIDVITVWSASYYRIQGYERVFTAIVSLITAYILWKRRARLVRVNTYLVKENSVQITEIELPPINVSKRNEKENNKK